MRKGFRYFNLATDTQEFLVPTGAIPNGAILKSGVVTGSPRADSGGSHYRKFHAPRPHVARTGQTAMKSFRIVQDVYLSPKKAQ